MSSGHHLQAHLNALNTSRISFEQAATLGVELVHHFDSDEHPIFHTADGDIVHRDAITDEWSVVDAGRSGVSVRSGELHRIHLPYIAKTALIADTANVHETATVEPGAKIGPHAHVGAHAHVGKDSTIASYARVEDGAFVGAFSSVHDGSRIAPGAIVGAGSRVGPTANIGAGARLEQRTQVDAFDNIAANTRTGSVHRRGSRLQPGQFTHLVERLAALDRD
jgi:carbonic anhydrase/acetyltransferase-like protein (isoleucine patch superfamily)